MSSSAATAAKRAGSPDPGLRGPPRAPATEDADVLELDLADVLELDLAHLHFTAVNH
jgi:hypothetical protein